MLNAAQNLLPIHIRLLSEADSLRALTDMLHRAYKQHQEIGLQPVAANQPEEITRKRIEAGECYVAELAPPGASATNGGNGEGTGREPGTSDPCHPRVVGTILFKAPHHPGPRGGTPHLNRDDVAHFAQFAVDPDYQGRGIGRRLMSIAEHRAAEIGAAEIALSTPEPAAWLIDMYQRHGYRIVERWHWPETNYTSAIMSKRV